MTRRDTLLRYVTSLVTAVPHSRCHALHGLNVLLKRDDELGCGVSGTKFRKYQSLIPYILGKNVKNVAVIGSAHSNNVLSLSQMLIEKGVTPHLFLKGANGSDTTGNFLLTRLLVAPTQIHFVSDKDWPDVEVIATEMMQKQEHGFVVGEGACQKQAFAGALTLALDLVLRDQLQDIAHVFVDAGTGLSAIALILGLAYLESRVSVHVALLADSRQVFLEKLAWYHSYFATEIKEVPDLGAIKKNIFLHQPRVAKSFGATNATVFQKIRHVAQTQGILLDPLYSVKLWMVMENVIAEQALAGQCLMIHSGGALSLMGFQDALFRALRNN